MTTEQPAMAQATKPRRHFKACECKYQREKAWGYCIHRYVGGRKYWKLVGVVATPELAEIKTLWLDCVLIQCNGCGMVVICEHPATATGERHE